jgi:hypothetical protein
VDNSIRLKQLQVGSEALRQGDEGLRTFIFFFKRVFFGWGRENEIIPSLSKGFFWVGLGKVIFCRDED